MVYQSNSLTVPCPSCESRQCAATTAKATKRRAFSGDPARLNVHKILETNGRKHVINIDSIYRKIKEKLPDRIAYIHLELENLLRSRLFFEDLWDTLLKRDPHHIFGTHKILLRLFYKLSKIHSDLTDLYFSTQSKEHMELSELLIESQSFKGPIKNEIDNLIQGYNHIVERFNTNEKPLLKKAMLDILTVLLRMEPFSMAIHVVSESRRILKQLENDLETI